MNLGNIGIVPNLKYECIYTTISKNGEKNAAPIGFVYLGDGKVKCNIFKNTITFKNINETQEYVVNITQDPLSFTYATIANIPEDYYTDDKNIAILKNAPSYLKIKVLDMEESTERPTMVITGEIEEVNIKDENIKAFNRGFAHLIESLVNYTRYDIADEKIKEYYDKKLKENLRVIKKVADDETIQAIEILKKEQDGR